MFAFERCLFCVGSFQNWREAAYVFRSESAALSRMLSSQSVTGSIHELGTSDIIEIKKGQELCFRLPPAPLCESGCGRSAASGFRTSFAKKMTMVRDFGCCKVCHTSWWQDVLQELQQQSAHPDHHHSWRVAKQDRLVRTVGGYIHRDLT